MADQKFFTVKLLHKTMITADVMELRFERPAELQFVAGQFVQFRVPASDGIVLRSYSVSSTPEETTLEFCTKILPDGRASKFFVDLTVGDTAEVSIPRGAFICRNDHHPVKIFVATGTGIAPIVSMIADRLGKGDTLRLVFGVRTEADLFWVDRLKTFEAKDPSFKYEITLSRPTEVWQGVKGRVTDCLPVIEQPANYYICGGLEMVKDVRARLTEQGIPLKQIHFEIF